MIDVLLAEDVRRQDAAAEAAGIPVARLMDNAGWAVARTARRMLRGCYGRRVVILCGTGNNSGDGLVAGRILRRQGAHVTAILTGDVKSPLAARNLEMFPGRIADLRDLAGEMVRADLVIDALLGVGVTRAPEGAIADAIRASDGARILSIDVPSGVDSDTGQVPGVAVRAADTITLGGFKPGLLFEPGRAHAGHVHIAGIGAPALPGHRMHALDASDVKEAWPARASADHKRKAGTVLVVAGSRAMPGAAALTSAASVHAGAGLTVLCAPEDVCRVALSRVPEMTTIPAPESGDGTIDPKVLDLIRPRLEEFGAIAIGPGLTTHPAAAETVRALLELDVPVVLDADGLNAVAGATEVLRARAAPTVITPHAGELARLTGRATKELDADRLTAARTAARDLGAVVVFKGPGTVIAGPDAIFVNEPGGPALAQGGTGDALTGLAAAAVAMSVARDRPVDETIVAAAAWIHGMAAERIHDRLAPHPANASALIDELGPTLHDVLNA